MKKYFLNKKVIVIGILVLILVTVGLLVLSLSQKYEITVETSPSGADVTIDNLSQKSPAVFSLKRGNYSLEISLDGYETIKSSFSVREDKLGHYNLISKSDNARQTFFERLPERKDGFLITREGNTLVVSIEKAPASTYKDQAIQCLRNEGVNVNTTKIIWDIPTYLRGT